MTGRMWREGAGAVLALYVLLAALGNVCVRLWDSTAHPAEPVGFGTIGPHGGGGLTAFAVTAFPAWRVSRGGHLSWVLLFLAPGVPRAVRPSAAQPRYRGVG